jgi:hypothetical protein
MTEVITAKRYRAMCSKPCGKRKKAQIEHEHLEQVEFFLKLKSEMPKLYSVAYAIPNGGKRDPTVAKKLKAEGVKAGVLDISIDEPLHGFHGLKIEMKRADGGSLSPEQKNWCKKFVQRGYAVAVCHGCSEALSAVYSYINGEFKQYEV